MMTSGAVNTPVRRRQQGPRTRAAVCDYVNHHQSGRRALAGNRAAEISSRRRHTHGSGCGGTLLESGARARPAGCSTC